MSSFLQCRSCRNAAAASLSCNHCGLTHYCGRICQAKDWKSHKVDCQATSPKKQQAETWNDLPRLSVRKLIGSKEEQSSEFAQLTLNLSMHGCIILGDLPDFSECFYNDFVSKSQSKISSDTFDDYKTAGQEVEPSSFRFPIEAVPYCSKSRRFPMFANDLVEHITRTLQLVFGTESIVWDRADQGTLTYMKRIPKRTIRQSSHLDGSVLSLVTPIPHEYKRDRECPSVNEGSALSSLECYHPDRRCFQKIALRHGEMVLLAGTRAMEMSGDRIFPCAHRVVTEPGLRDRLSFVCSSSSSLERKELDTRFLRERRFTSIPTSVQMRLNRGSGIWNDVTKRIQDFDWLLPQSIDMECSTCPVDTTEDEDDDPPLLLDPEDFPIPDWN